MLNEKNVIIRNVKISKVLASAGDAIGIQAASQVWVDHLDLSSDRDHDKVSFLRLCEFYWYKFIVAFLRTC